jgi:acetyltransferase-like isoleucine patch superfamily enzyme
VIHPTAVVADDTRLAEVEIGPFTVIGLDGDGGAVTLDAGAIVRSHSVVYRGTRLGRGVHLGHGVLVREHTTIADGASVGSHTVLEHHVTIGEGARLHSSCFIPELSVIEAGAWIGPQVTVTNARYPNRPDTKAQLEGVTIETDAVIGAGAVLLPGVTIGAGALVGAGAVVIRDVAPGERVVGNPARPLAWRGGSA